MAVRSKRATFSRRLGRIPTPVARCREPIRARVFLNQLADLYDRSLLHLERRFDPFFRPAFDATLRDPIARFVTRIDQQEAA